MEKPQTDTGQRALFGASASVALAFSAREGALPPDAPAGASRPAPQSLPEGFDGWLSLRAAESLDEAEAAATLARLDALMGWAQAQQARVVARVEELVDRKAKALLPADQTAGAVLSATAAEVGAVLRLPHMSAMRLVSESGKLTRERSATLAHLSYGAITYPQARVLLEELQFVPPEDAPAFESEVLRAAPHLTAAQLSRRARTLRERRYPDTIRQRHRDALSKRRVWLEPAPDGMACLGAMMAAEKGMALFGALSAAARANKNSGDGRTMDQLRVDLLTGTLLGTSGREELSLTEPPGPCARSASDASPAPDSPDTPDTAAGAGTAPVSAAAARAGGADAGALDTGGPDADSDQDLSRVKAEVMVIINADTLFGGDDHPAELAGYGPISADAARQLARRSRYWTGLVRDPSTGEILAVGRRRKVPAGLSRWLRARDGTCRFPGCSVNATRSEIDHTVPWSHGGRTDHDNLAHLCPKHHRLKSQGFWNASQDSHGQLTWSSSLDGSYTTEPQLTLRPPLILPKDGTETRRRGDGDGDGDGARKAVEEEAAKPSGQAAGETKSSSEREAAKEAVLEKVRRRRFQQLLPPGCPQTTSGDVPPPF